MSLSLRSSLLVLALTVFVAACVEKKPLGEGQACPCAPGWRCDTTIGKCVSDQQDASADLPMDAKPNPLIDANADFFPTDVKPCPAGQVLRYMQPGCGMAAQPVCGSASQDACARASCGCDGQTIYGCDFFDKPWSHAGACSGPIDGGPLPTDGPTSGRPNCTPIGRDLTCDPTGNWTVTFFNPTVACDQGGQNHSFTVLAEGGLFCIFSQQTDYPSITVSPDGCKLEVAGSRQTGSIHTLFESWELSLTVAGLGGAGTLAYHSQQDAICNASWDASGQRTPLTDGGLVVSPGNADAM